MVPYHDTPSSLPAAEKPTFQPRSGCGAELEDLQSPAEQIDVVDGLGTLIAATDDPSRKQVAAIRLANADVFRPQRNPHLLTHIRAAQLSQELLVSRVQNGIAALHNTAPERGGRTVISIGRDRYR